MTANLLRAERARRLSMQALAVLGIAILAGSLAAAAYYATLPYAGFEFVGPRRIGAIVPGSPAEAAGLRVGDEVVLMDGEPFKMGRAYLRPGQEVLRLTVSRGGQAIPVAIALATPSLKERFFAFSHLLVGLAFWIVAMAALALKPRDAAAQLFVLVTLLGVVALVVWLLADLGLVWANLLMATIVVVLGPLFVHFHTLFPQRADFRGRRALLACLYAVALILWLLSTSSGLAGYLQLEPEEGRLSSLRITPLLEAFFSLCLLIGLILLLRGRFMAKSETSRRRAALVLLGTALALLPFIVLIAIPHIFSAPYLVPTWLALLALVFIPLSYVYAIYRRDLIKLDRVINRTAVFYLLALVLAGLYVGSSLAIRRLLPGASPGTVTVADAGLFVGLLLLVDPLKQRTQIAVDRTLYGGWYNYQSFISRTSEALRDALDVSSISRLLAEDVAGTMRFQAVALLLPNRQGRAYSMRGGQGFDGALSLSAGSPIARHLMETGKPVEHAALRDRFSADATAGPELATWSEAGAQMWVPLIQQGDLLGLLALGSKRADEFVTRGDLDILNTLAQQVTLALCRLRLVDDLQSQMEEVRAMGRQILQLQERNQHRLARELHDQLLQDLVVVRNLLEQTQETFVPARIAEARETLLELTGYLRTIMFELRSPAWEDVDLRTALEDYALTFEERRGLPVLFQAHGEGPGDAVPEEVRTAIFRILQESLNNAATHAQAQQVEVRLEIQPDRVRLEVQDDGVGFEVPSHLSGHVDRGRLGLVSMRERAEEVGGTLTIESEPGLGARILVEVPLTAPWSSPAEVPPDRLVTPIVPPLTLPRS